MYVWTWAPFLKVFYEKNKKKTRKTKTFLESKVGKIRFPEFMTYCIAIVIKTT